MNVVPVLTLLNVPAKVEAIFEFLPKAPERKPGLVVSSLRGPASLIVTPDTFGSISAAEYRAHFSLSKEQQIAVLADTNLRFEYLNDTYMDTRDFALLNNNFWLRVRNQTSYAFKGISLHDRESDTDYLEVGGFAKDLPRWKFSRFLFSLQIVRCFRGADNESWVDFVVIENGRGQRLFDCVGTIHGSHLARADLGLARYSSALIATQGFYSEKIKTQVSDMTPLLCDRPDFWPEWQSPLPKFSITAAERAAIIEYAMMVRDEEIEAGHGKELTVDNVIKEQHGAF